MLQDRLAAAGFEGFSSSCSARSWSCLWSSRRRAWSRGCAPARCRCCSSSARRHRGAGRASRVWGDPLDWLAVGMLAAAVVAFLPGLRRRGRPDARSTRSARRRSRMPDAGQPSRRARPAGIDRAPAPASVPGIGEPIVGLYRRGEALRRRAGARRRLARRPRGRAGRPGRAERVGQDDAGQPPLRHAPADVAGTIRVAGQDIAGLPPHRIAHAGVARTYQIPRPFASMTVRDNVAMALMFGRAAAVARRPRDGRPRSTSTLVGLGRLADALPVRAQPAPAPAAGDGPRARDRARACCCSTRRSPGSTRPRSTTRSRSSGASTQSGISIVLVEHLLRVVNQLATRIVVLDRGRTLADGEPARSCADPAVVRAYLGGARAPHVLEVRDLDVRYGDAQALWGVDLDGRRRRDGLHRRARTAPASPRWCNAIAGMLPRRRGVGAGRRRRRRRQPAHRVCRSGVAIVPEGRRVFPGMTVERQPRPRRLPARRPGRVARGVARPGARRCSRGWPSGPASTPGQPVRRRAADARHRPGADGAAAPAAARRAVARPGAGRRRRGLRRDRRRSTAPGSASSWSSRTSSARWRSPAAATCWPRGESPWRGRPPICWPTTSCAGACSGSPRRSTGR